MNNKDLFKLYIFSKNSIKFIDKSKLLIIFSLIKFSFIKKLLNIFSKQYIKFFEVSNEGYKWNIDSFNILKSLYWKNKSISCFGSFIYFIKKLLKFSLLISFNKIKQQNKKIFLFWIFSFSLKAYSHISI